MKETSKKGEGWTLTLALTVCSAAIGGTFQYGYNISIINAPTSHLQKFINETCVRRWGTALGPTQVTVIWTVIVSSFSLGGLFGSLLAGPMAIRFGRKGALLLNNCFLLLSAVFVLSSRSAGSFEMVILARLLVGVNAGVSMNVQPMYFGESAPKDLRGAVTFSSAVFTALGILLGQVTGLTEVLGSESVWPYLLASNALPGLVQLLTLPWFPESPRYLLIDKGDSKACIQALKRLRACSVFDSEMEEILQERTGTGEVRAKTMWELFADRSLRRQLCTVMAASSAMMLCGNDSIYFYASYIFQEAGIPLEKIQYVAIGTGACEFTSAVVCNLLIERVGRRLLLAGVTGILPAELFDQMARPAAYMVAGSMMWLNLFLMGMAFPFIVNGLGQFCFIPFGGVCVAGCLFIGFTLPETKGRTLAEITKEFDKRNEKVTSNGFLKCGQRKQSQSLTDQTAEYLEIEKV
ncbi:solute carrier family 2, facilitated glucose transporter member 11 isoform X2 [Misgurnus anguillicaudatus]|uniref:solute carrier family 2, facilitated glucose transporter member 11 isoform X2 n=1 Tax=Misgurnus anguillicaudatus TaxID=75329 RepID=UPI003CCF2064